MPLRNAATLFGKELRELAASRAYWLLLVMMGPLVGQAFITAVNLYAEVSGAGGRPAALAEGLSPLDGIFVPTFGAYDLAATLLFPFVAIRSISAEKESGGWKLMLQQPAGMSALVGAKMFGLILAWFIAWVPGLLAIALWRVYGGHIHPPELVNLLLGHFLRALLSAGVAVAAAALTGGAASAAIATLAFTLGTWALDFIAAGRGGWLQQLAAYTPTAALRTFERGEFRLRTALILLLLGVLGFFLAGVWLRLGASHSRRLIQTAVVLAAFSGGMLASSALRTSLDVSENRRNSFPPAAERVLRQIPGTLHITIGLAAEDPRLTDYEANILNKLRRTLNVAAEYAATSRAGLFEGDHYGEIWYEWNGRRLMSRSTVEPIVLETIYQVAGVQPPAGANGAPYPGYPLAKHPDFAAWLFYLALPLAALLGCWLNWLR